MAAHLKLHSAEHTDGTDDIQDATSGQKGLATATQITKLDGIEALADVTDAANVSAAGAFMTDGSVNMSGEVSLAGGWVGNPGLRFASDVNLGLYRVGENNIGITCGNSRQMDLSPSGVLLENGVRVDEFSDDGTLADDSDTAVPTEKAVKTYVDSLVQGAIVLQSDWDADTNSPDISGTTTTGHAWRVSVAGTTDLGGTTDWEVGDMPVKTATGWLKIDNEDIAAVWGNISGTLSNQTDLQSALNDKQDVLTEGAFVDGDKTKLDGIEALADVTDATNVDAAGATMNADTDLSSNGYFLDEDDMASDSATKVPSQQSVKAYVDNSVSSVDTLVLSTAIEVHGFEDRTETSISFDDSTYVFTLTDAGSGWTYYRSGVRNTVSGNKTTTLAGSPPTADKYYIYIDAADGTLSNSTTAWTLADNKVPVATVEWDNTATPKYKLADERHTTAWNRTEHAHDHLTIGATLQTRGAISGYTLEDDTDSSIQYDLAQSIIWDEDLKSTIAGITGGSDNYHIIYRTGASSWSWKESTMPYSYNSEAGGGIDYDTGTGMAEVTNNDRVNTYIIATNETGLSRYSILHGGIYETLTQAQSENFEDLDRSGLDLSEAVAIWKITWRANGGYSSTGKCFMEAEPEAIGVNLTVSGQDPSLGGLAYLNAVEGVDILSTGETGGTKYLREDGDGTCSWQEVAGGGGATLDITQAGHGFGVEDVIYNNAGTWTEAQADDADTLGMGVVSAVDGTDDFTIAVAGPVTSTSHGYTVGQYLYLDASTAGALTETAPTGLTEYSNPIAYVADANTLLVLPLRPTQALQRSNDFKVTSTSSAAYTVADTDEVILADASSAAITVTLPTPADAYAGFTVTVKKTDSSGNAVTVKTATGYDIDGVDGATGQAISSQYDSLTVVCDGSDYWVI
jgi:hypothetical protein